MKKFNLLVAAALFIAVIVIFTSFFMVGCNGTATVKEDTVKIEPATVASPEVVTNPNFVIAPIEYTDLTLKALEHMSKFEFDAWGDMLSDNVKYSFPDGDIDTRTTLVGRDEVVKWWKNWKATSGIESMTMTEFNNLPINIIVQPKGGAMMGIYVISYFSNKMVFRGKPVSVRMNFTIHFNAEKKIDRYSTYYDRAVIIKATGVNVLDKKGK